MRSRENYYYCYKYKVVSTRRPMHGCRPSVDQGLCAPRVCLSWTRPITSTTFSPKTWTDRQTQNCNSTGVHGEIKQKTNTARQKRSGPGQLSLEAAGRKSDECFGQTSKRAGLGHNGAQNNKV